MSNKFDVLVIGAGAAGLTSAVYTCRKKLRTGIITVDVGGQTNLTNHIENYPGVDAMPGPDLMKKFQENALSFGAEFIYGKVVSVSKNGEVFVLKLSNDEVYECKALILAFGKVARSLGVPGEEKFFGRGVSTCATCLPPSETIIANSCAKSIDEINTNNRVLTENGKFYHVLEKMEREYSGDLIEIKTRFFTEPVELTANHPVWKMTVKKGIGKNYWNFKFSEPEWVRADMLKKNDLVFYPVIKENKDKKHILISEFVEDIIVDKSGFAKNKRETHTAKRIPNKIIINEDFTRLVGYYLAEGCITSRGINLYFNKKEVDYVNDVKSLLSDIFEIEPRTKIEGNVCRISVFSNIIRELFEKLFGKYSYNKRVPHWFMMLPNNKQAELIKGVWRGDGCKRDKDFCIVTNSRNLAYQLRDLLLRLNILPSIQRRRLEVLKSTKINDRIVKFKHDKYHIIIGGPNLEKMSFILGTKHEKIGKTKHNCKHAFFKDNFVLLPIRYVKSKYYKGKVMNIMVENNHTYVAKNFIVHNCDAPLFKNKTAVVIGGGNSALEAVEELSKIAKQVYLIHRRDSFKADEITVDKIKKLSNVEFILNSVAKEIKGDKVVSSIVVEEINTKQTREVSVNGVFVEIGYVVDTSMVKDLVKVNEANEIVIDSKNNTSCHGIFAAGDVTTVPYKQTVISAGEGAKAALECYRYLSGHKGKLIDW